MTAKRKTSETNGNGESHAGVGEHLSQTAETARELFEEAQQAVVAFDLKGKVNAHPYGMVVAAFGVGYVLGGGLFTATTARVLRLGVRLAAVPAVRDSLLGVAEAAVDQVMASAKTETKE